MSKRQKPMIIPPDGGWKPWTIYVVQVAYRKNNPIHVALFQTGFLNDQGEPAGYNGVMTLMPPTNSWDPDSFPMLDEVYYMQVIREALTEVEAETLKTYKMPPKSADELEQFKRQQMEEGRVLVISSAHLSKDTLCAWANDPVPRGGTGMYREDLRFGWLVFWSDDNETFLEQYEQASEDVRDCVDWARARGYSYIRFDEDAYEIESQYLRQYDHGA